jgi:hypothetical protein
MDANSTGIRRLAGNALPEKYFDRAARSLLNTSLYNVILFSVNQGRGPEILFRKEVYTIVGAALEVLRELGHGIHEKPY